MAADEQRGRRTALIKATIARGRAVIDLDGVRRKADSEIELPAADVDRLRKLGFLVDPKAPAVPRDIGPRWGGETGPKIRRG